MEIPIEILDRLDQRYGKWVAYDIETEPFNDTNPHPKPRVMVIFVSWLREMQPFTRNEMEEGLKIFKEAETIVSFNGRSFDERVLVAHTSLSRRFPKKKSLDLCAELQSRYGKMTSLDKLVQMNFGERKMVSGREISKLSLKELIPACESDVRHTILILDYFSLGKLKANEPFTRDWLSLFGGPQSSLHGKGKCNSCEKRNGYFEESNPEEMTEGQYATYEGGYWGIWVCRECEHRSYIEL